MSKSELSIESAPVCECFAHVREVSLGRIERFIDDPDQASPVGPQSTVEVTIEAIGGLNELATSRKSGRQWIISEPAHVGGKADAPSPLEYMLSGAIGCFSAVFAFYAALDGVNYDTFVVDATAVLDVRGHVLEDAPPSGFQSVHLDIKVGGADHPDRLDAILEKSMRGCPGIRTFEDPVRFVVNLENVDDGS